MKKIGKIAVLGIVISFAFPTIIHAGPTGAAFPEVPAVRSGQSVFN